VHRAAKPSTKEASTWFDEEPINGTKEKMKHIADTSVNGPTGFIVGVEVLLPGKRDNELWN